jgi:hypothetical protein
MIRAHLHRFRIAPTIFSNTSTTPCAASTSPGRNRAKSLFKK